MFHICSKVMTQLFAELIESMFHLEDNRFPLLFQKETMAFIQLLENRICQ